MTLLKNIYEDYTGHDLEIFLFLAQLVRLTPGSTNLNLIHASALYFPLSWTLWTVWTE